MKVLVTGFEPLRQYWKINPSWEAVSRLPGQVDNAVVIKEKIPLVFDKAEHKLAELIEQHLPDAVICVGQSGEDNAIAIERIGINLDDFNVPDNDGNLRIDKKVVENGPDAYFTTLPVRAMAKAVEQAGIPSVLSDETGTHLCNHVTYFTRHLAETRFPHIISGFIHVPLDISQCVEGRSRGRYFMDVNTTTRGLEAAIQAVVGYLRARES